MIDLQYGPVQIRSTQSQVQVFARQGGPDTAVTLPNLAFGGSLPLLDRTDLPLAFDAMELTLSVAGVSFGGHWKRHSEVAELLATLTYAGTFADATPDIGPMLLGRQEIRRQAEQLLTDLQDRHLRARLARMLGVNVTALAGFQVGTPRGTRSGRSVTLEGQILSVPVVFALEYEHVLLYVSSQPARQVRTYTDILGPVQAAAKAPTMPGGRQAS